MRQVQELSYIDLALSAVLLLVPLVLSWRQRLDVHHDLLIGAVRCFAQLTVMGYLLRFIFDLDSAPAVMAWLAVMIILGAHTASGRLRDQLMGVFQLNLLSVGVTSIVTLAFVTQVVVRVQPWYSPPYLIGLAGMIIGNAMNGSALAGERLVSEMRLRRGEIEVLLSLGATPRQASAEAVRATVKASLIPPINSLMTVGLVHLPGIMTGQIIGGAQPDLATRYQVMIMYSLTFVSAVTAIIMTSAASKRFFNARQQLRGDMVARPVR